ncbi:MAG: hypothetical protein KME42_19770 [Tildeniella nuda ZEHNDER 1965/U140]|jgi:hypothetical protein|nr:hypothetical protein [Tildeniella nuda ZEHNDER 1965/U140]
MPTLPNSPSFRYVPDRTEALLSLFPHRFNFLYAEHPIPRATPEWRTENRHPLSDRLIRQGAYVYGVRFGKLTRYAMLDIDAGSIYHPQRDRFAIDRIMAALEPLGIVAHLAVTSSYSAGVHLYLPFEQPQKSWELAAAISSVLESAGFKIEPGILELYPNPRSWDPETTTLYNGHRLPLQAGSYLLTADYNLTNANDDLFCQRWQFCTLKNDVQTAVLKRAIRRTRRKHERLSHRASKFLNDLNCCIDLGWSGHGQTNLILGRIALRSYVFGHILKKMAPLEGDRLIADIVATAMQLPGYRDWCRHQHEIWRRAEDWARCVENSRYWHCGVPKPESVDTTESEVGPECGNTWNLFQQLQARSRLRDAIADLLNREALPATARDRFCALVTRYQFSGSTLYHHRDLWHPDCLWIPPRTPLTFLSFPVSPALGARLNRRALQAY